MSKDEGARCVVCNVAIEVRSQNRFFPFCSSRCKQIDLGRWLNEEYAIRVSRDESERDDLPSHDLEER